MREAQISGRPGLTIFTDGSRLENGATGYAVAWKKGDTWKGHKTHMGWCQEAYDAAIARALPVAASRNHALGTVTIFQANDCQETYRRPPSERARSQNRDRVVPKPPKH